MISHWCNFSWSKIIFKRIFIYFLFFIIFILFKVLQTKLTKSIRKSNKLIIKLNRDLDWFFKPLDNHIPRCTILLFYSSVRTILRYLSTLFLIIVHHLQIIFHPVGHNYRLCCDNYPPVCDNYLPFHYKFILVR